MTYNERKYIMLISNFGYISSVFFVNLIMQIPWEYALVNVMFIVFQGFITYSNLSDLKELKNEN
jgi:hypothetical protein